MKSPGDRRRRVRRPALVDSPGGSRVTRFWPAAARAANRPSAGWCPAGRKAVTAVPLEITDSDSVSAALSRPFEAMVHLAAVASVREAREDPGRAWVVNAAGTARLVDAAVGAPGDTGVRSRWCWWSPAPRSTAAGQLRLAVETDPLLAPVVRTRPAKWGREVAALEAWRRTGLRVVIARAFPHTGPGQSSQSMWCRPFSSGSAPPRPPAQPEVRTGNLDPVRDLLDVRDVAAAYLALLAHGVARARCTTSPAEWA